MSEIVYIKVSPSFVDQIIAEALAELEENRLNSSGEETKVCEQTDDK